MADATAADPGAQEATCKCDRGLACNIMHGMGGAVGVLVILNAIMNLMNSPAVVDAILAVYLVILGLVGILAEVRVIRAIRTFIFPVMKFVYFLTNYNARGFFWIFCGTISLGDNILNYVTCAVAAGDGLLLMVLNCYWKFPVWVEPQIAKMQLEARLRWERDEAQRKLLAAQSQASTPVANAVNNTRQSAASAQGTAVSMAEAAYEPPKI